MTIQKKLPGGDTACSQSTRAGQAHFEHEYTLLVSKQRLMSSSFIDPDATAQCGSVQFSQSSCS